MTDKYRTIIAEKLKTLEIQLGEEDAKQKEKEKAEAAAAKDNELSEAEKAKQEDEKKEKEFSERVSRKFSEVSKDMNDRICALEESVSKVVEMSEKYFSKK